MPVSRDELLKLKDRVDLVLIALERELKAANNDRWWRAMGCVNWADLSCVRAAYEVGHDGVETLVVYIEEAAGDAVGLQLEVAKRLVAHGYDEGSVEVRTEW